MTMLNLAWISFFTQGALISVDEFYCHRRRLLPRWELAGHPLDTFFILSFFGALMLVPKDEPWARGMVLILGLISCLVITKDEWIHKFHSSAFENWLHSLLFLIHPVVIITFYLSWTEADLGSFQVLVGFSAALVGSFFIYQCVQGVRLWNLQVP